MIDQYGRTIEYLRISVTDRCNLRCKYCMPEQPEWIAHEQILRYEELLFIAKAAIDLGITHFKITGGEPLVRKGVVDFIRQLRALPGCNAVTLTTNGILLKELAQPLKDAGLDAVNISLDTRNPQHYAEITGVDGLQSVLEGVDAALVAGLRTKLNCVLLKSTQDQVVPLAAMAEEKPLDVRFIELMPIGEGMQGGGFSPLEARKCLLERWPDLHPVEERRGYGPARYEASAQLKGRIGWINAVSHGFCDQCNRIRLTCTGQLKPCLCYETRTDLRALIRNGASMEELRQALQQAIYQKPNAHCFKQVEEVTEHHPMAQIGG